MSYASDTLYILPYRVQYLSNDDGKWEDVSCGYKTYEEARESLFAESIDTEYSHRIIKMEVLAFIERGR